MIVIQVSFSLFKSVDWIGEAPRYFGKMDPWTLIGAILGISKIACGMIFPYAMTTIISGFFSFNRSVNSRPSSDFSGLSFVGVEIQFSIFNFQFSINFFAVSFMIFSFISIHLPDGLSH